MGGQLETLINMTKKKYGGVTIIPEMIIEYLSDDDKQLTDLLRETTIEESFYRFAAFFEKEEIINAMESTILQCLPKSIRSLKKPRVKILPIS